VTGTRSNYLPGRAGQQPHPGQDRGCREKLSVGSVAVRVLAALGLAGLLFVSLVFFVVVSPGATFTALAGSPAVNGADTDPMISIHAGLLAASSALVVMLAETSRDVA